MPRIRLTTKKLSFEADLRETITTQKLLAVLPCQSTISTWGDEIYFQIPVNSILEEDAEQVVEPGTVGFWVEGQSLAIPFGPTPISEGQECRLAARVNLLGKVVGDPKRLKDVNAGESITIELVKD